eukprot:4340879-Pyramimonas_sp.AAC.1
MPLVSGDFVASWSSKVVASDASFWGYSVVARHLPRETVQQLGRASERDSEDAGWVKKVEEDAREREDTRSDLPPILKER